MRFGLNTDRHWSFQVDGKACQVAVSGRRIANSGDLVRLWCLEGYGLCLKSIWDVQVDLDGGRLVEVLAAFSTGRTALQIVYPDPSAAASRAGTDRGDRRRTWKKSALAQVGRQIAQ